jgi:hypothetical protein
MTANKEALVLIFKQISSLIGRLSDDEIDDILSGKLIFALKEKGGKGKKNKRSIDEEKIEEFISKLRSMNERENGIALLETEGVDKYFLKRLARNIDISTSDRDNIETLVERIIEATIGYRLRSKAIQGHSNSGLSNKKDLLKKKSF